MSFCDIIFQLYLSVNILLLKFNYTNALHAVKIILKKNFFFFMHYTIN